jgi:CheY-like chemotaxis protein
MVLPVSPSFAFHAQALPQKLSQASKGMTGYWLCELLGSSRMNGVQPWYLALSQGKVLFSGDQQLSWQVLLKIFQRYIPQLRSDRAKDTLHTLEKHLIADSQKIQSQWFLDLLSELQNLDLVHPEDVAKSLRQTILSDFDAYLFDCSGQAQFLPAPELNIQAPNLGFEIEDLITAAIARRAWWHKLKTQIPSMDSVPLLNREAIQRSLTPTQQQQLQALVSRGKTLNSIAAALAQDSLEIAKVFAKLANDGLITFAPSLQPAAPEIFFIDDSPLLLKQFESLVTRWGYVAKVSDDPTIALQSLLNSMPAVIFLDINMPDVTGFDLVKQIRRQPKLVSVPLIMLTAEKTLSNNWKARWSSCRFLTKPLLPSEVPQFQTELRMMLTELAPLDQHNSTEGNSVHRPQPHYRLGNSLI